MISIIGVTNNYSLQPALLDKHSSTLSWLSSTMHWKSEFAFFQNLLEEMRPSISSAQSLTELEIFENQVTYFMIEAIEDLRKRLRNHENKLAKMLEAKSEWDVEYYKEHDTLMNDALMLSERIKYVTDSIRRWTTNYLHETKTSLSKST